MAKVSNTLTYLIHFTSEIKFKSCKQINLIKSLSLQYLKQSLHYVKPIMTVWLIYLWIRKASENPHHSALTHPQSLKQFDSFPSLRAQSEWEWRMLKVLFWGEGADLVNLGWSRVQIWGLKFSFILEHIHLSHGCKAERFVFQLRTRTKARMARCHPLQ